MSLGQTCRDEISFNNDLVSDASGDALGISGEYQLTGISLSLLDDVMFPNTSDTFTDLSLPSNLNLMGFGTKKRISLSFQDPNTNDSLFYSGNIT